MIGDHMIEIVVAVLVLTLVLGVPVVFSLATAALAGVLILESINPAIMPQQMLQGISRTTLLAIPCFLLAGDIMTVSGMTDRLIRLANGLFGRFRGGLAYSNVSASVLMAGVSGSAIADTSAIGRVMIPAMIKEGYGRGFSASLTSTVNLIGPILPPSITFILIGVLAELSITRLFLAGVIPGLLFAVVMAVVAGRISIARNYPIHGRVSGKEIWIRFKAAGLALAMPVLIVVGLRFGIFNVTECSAFAVAYAFFVGGFVYRTLTPKLMLEALVRTANTTGIIFVILAGAQALAWLLAYEHVPQVVAELMLTLTENPWIILLILNVFLLLVGTFMEPGPSIVILIPVLYPVVSHFGIDPIQFSVVMAMNLVIGIITPPVAVSLAITGSIAKCPSSELIRELMPFFLAAVFVVLLISYIPQLSLWLPNLVLGPG